MAIYKSKYLLKAERIIKAGKYVAKDCEVKYVEAVPLASDSYQKLQKFKNTAADYEEVNIAMLEALAKDKFQKEIKVELPSHKEKRELLLETEGRISGAKNDSAAKDLFEGRENYKELVNDLNYPRGLRGQVSALNLILAVPYIILGFPLRIPPRLICLASL